METFLEKYDSKISGILHGFDRIIIKDHIQKYYAGNNFYYFLNKENVLLKDFKAYSLKINKILK